MPYSPLGVAKNIYLIIILINNTQMVLVQVKIDIMMSIDQYNQVLFVLLDLSAFHRVDRNALFFTLKDRFRLSSKVL